MKIRAQLLAGVAAIAFSTSAWADDNSTYLDQNGSDNVADVTQSGSEGNVGLDTPNGRVLQDGDRNTIIIDQAGSRRSIGAAAGVTNALGSLNGTDGINQTGNDNVLTIDQTRPGNFRSTVNEVQQTNSSGTGTNIATIDQPSNAGRINRVEQINTGAADNTVDVFQAGFTNSIGSIANNQLSGGLIQDGEGNSISVSQDEAANNGSGVNSNRNKISSVVQTGTNNTISLIQNGNGNTADASQIGNGNGRAALLGASAVGAASGTIDQDGTANMASLDITGDDNGFGVDQFGDNNSVGTLSITGSGNLLGVMQTSAVNGGVGNTVSVGVIEGDGNDVGVSQNGTNTATVNIIGAASDGNTISLNQDFDTSGGGAAGGTNSALIDVAGLDNDLTVDQFGSNTFDVDITGDNNLLDTDQTGASNNISGSTTGNLNEVLASQTGSSNSISFTQVGTNNTIDAMQNGSGNMATFSQGVTLLVAQ